MFLTLCRFLRPSKHAAGPVGRAGLALAALLLSASLTPAVGQDGAGRASDVLQRFGLDRSGEEGALGQSRPTASPAWETPAAPAQDTPTAAAENADNGAGTATGLAVPLGNAPGFDPPASIRLITPVAATGDLPAIPAGLEVVLEPGWKSYWRSPGAAGLPPTLTPTDTRNLEAWELAFPAPERFSLFGLDTFGYAERVVYPLTLTPSAPGEALSLTANADLLVCSDICVPVSQTVSLDLPPGPAAPDPALTQSLDRWRAQVPQDAFSTGIEVTGAGWTGEALVVTATADPPIVDAASLDVLVEAAGDWFFAAPEIRLTDGGRHLTARMVPTETGLTASLTETPVRLTLLAGTGDAAADTGARALDWRGTVALGLPETAAAAAGLSLATILLLAVAGGLILNVMPCVLPVLSLKLFSLIQDGGKAPAVARRGLLVTAAGILASFWVLAGALIAIGLAGGAIGWGIQFQQPVFLAFMIAVLALFAANMAGLFEIVLPDRLGQAALAGGSREGWLGQFGTGAFATLLATPCSAPFLGTAVGFALARGPVEILAVFTALALGFALPYLAVAAVPGAVRLLPKPGAWMLRVKQVMALALAGTAVWLLTVLAVAGGPIVAAAVSGLVLLGVAIIAAPRVLGRDGWRRPAGIVAAGLFAMTLTMPGLLPEGRATATVEAGASWEAWSSARVTEALGEGRVVFVDVTADWCLTCIANKRLVLDRGAVAAALESPSILPLQADWTRPDPAIADFLARFGRYGIPFNVVYGPGAPDGIVLPELLTEGAVLDALAAAGATDVAAVR